MEGHAKRPPLPNVGVILWLSCVLAPVGGALCALETDVLITIRWNLQLEIV
jgi:hypothetical protein